MTEIFRNPAGEPEEPPRGAIQEPTKEELTFLDESINIQAPDPWGTTYREMLYRYHDVISKGKFDLGWTDVVEHKINLTDDDPVHIRQFRIPLEHRQTISTGWMSYSRKGQLRCRGAPTTRQYFLSLSRTAKACKRSWITAR